MGSEFTDIVFSADPEDLDPVFVGVVDSRGLSGSSIGSWVPRDDGFDALRLNGTPAQIAAAPELYAALRKLEWSGYGIRGNVCPACRRLENFEGQHADGCTLAAALAKAEGREERDD